MIKDDVKKTIEDNNATISRLLRENEQLLRDAGFQPPARNYGGEREKRINFPNSYIRVNEYFQNSYHLNEIVKSKAVRKNIAYALQLTDLQNYIINRFYLWGSVETMFLKGAIINGISIFEALIFECANNICDKPGQCGSHSICDICFNKPQRNNSFQALSRMKELNIVSFSEEEMERIKELIGMRNRVHIRLAEENEFLSKDFSVSTYNEIIRLNRRLSDMIFQHGVDLYDRC